MSNAEFFFAGNEAMYQAGEWFILQKQFAPDLVMNFMLLPEGDRENCTVFDGGVFTIPYWRPEPTPPGVHPVPEQPEIMGDFCFAIQNVPPKLAPASEERFAPTRASKWR